MYALTWANLPAVLPLTMAPAAPMRAASTARRARPALLAGSSWQPTAPVRLINLAYRRSLVALPLWAVGGSAPARRAAG